MKFKLNHSGAVYTEEEAKRLVELGFTKRPVGIDGPYLKGHFKVFGEPEIEINTIEDLEELRRKSGHEIIIGDGWLKIYDDWLE